LGLGLDGDTYRRKALDCVLTADKVRDPSVRLSLLSLAIDYVSLADYADQRHESGAANRGDKHLDIKKDG